MQTLSPDKRNDWLNQADNDWDHLLRFCDPKAGPLDSAGKVNAIFRLMTNGAETRRDEWLWHADKDALRKQVQYLIDEFNRASSAVKAKDISRRGTHIKWDSELDKLLKTGKRLAYEDKWLQSGAYRAFSKQFTYTDPDLNGRVFRLPYMFTGEANPAFAFRAMASSDPIAPLAVDGLFDQGLVKTGNGRTFGVSRYRYTKSGERVDNITDWGLNKFTARYGRKGVTKDAIFAYCYAVLHDPVYRETYALNLKREFPRIPFYPDFAQWVAWGEALMAMHIGYEQVEPWALDRIDVPEPKRAPGTHPKPVLKSHPDKGCVVVDADTQLTGIPKEAWDYRLGNRSAIDWVLDQHKEKKPRDPTIAAKFNTYRFADYKESMIDLLARVVRVSVDTVAITAAMQALDRSDWDE